MINKDFCECCPHYSHKEKKCTKDGKELNRYNKEKLQKMQKELEVLRKKNADSCEVKKSIINNGYHVCPSELDCNR